MYKDDDDHNRFTRRALVFGSLGLMGFAGLSSRLYQLQVLDAKKYRGLSEENQFNYRLLVPSRGQILDRTGQVIAGNTENFRLLLLPEQVQDLDRLLSKLSTFIDVSDARKTDIRKAFARRDSFSLIRVIDNMDWETFAKINLWLPDLPGIQPEVGEFRQYSSAEALAHIIGYVGRVPPNLAEEGRPLFRHPGFRIGLTGVERNFDTKLRGKAGALKYEVNAFGRVIREIPNVRTQAVAGEDLRLSLDRNLQLVAQQALAGTSGAACVLDVNTGEVRALISTPAFDPNKFARGISQVDYNALLNDKYKPLFNKALGGAFPPASCFKPVVAMAAIDAGLADQKERIHCKGKIKLGDRLFHCWHRPGHGRVNLNESIGVSCDIYFYELAKRLGIQRISDAAKKLGFGQLFDLGLGGGSKGIVPNRAWKRARFDLPWSQGETLIAGIGQGYLTATPVQLAVMTARIATGRKIVPTLLQNPLTTKPMQEPVEFSPRAYHVAREGLASVVNRPWGTAYSPEGIDGSGMKWAGKTGTGQVRQISMAERDDRVLDNEELSWELRDHALFVAYAPLKDPQFAIAVVVEHGGSGSREAAPRAVKILQYALAQDLLEKSEQI